MKILNKIPTFVFLIVFLVIEFLIFWFNQKPTEAATQYYGWRVKEYYKPSEAVSFDGPKTSKDKNEDIIVGLSPIEEHEIDEDELYIIAHLLSGECQTLSWECQEAVASVILNRVEDPEFPSSVKGVVFQRGQYACTWDGNYDRKPTERNWKVARYVLRYGSQIPKNVIYQAQFKQGSGIWKKIDTETFCYR